MTDCENATAFKNKYLEEEGYTVVRIWECTWDNMKKNDPSVKEILKSFDTKKFADKLFINWKHLREAVLLEEAFGFIQVDIYTPEELKASMR